MVGSRSRPTLAKLGLLVALLIAGVLFYVKLSSLSLNSLLEPRGNRKQYEALYAEAMDEVADWRQRYDSETAKSEEHKKFLSQVELEAKHLQQEKERLSAEVYRLKEELDRQVANG